MNTLNPVNGHWSDRPDWKMTRRDVLKLGGTLAVASAAPPLLASAGGSSQPKTSAESENMFGNAIW